MQVKMQKIEQQLHLHSSCGHEHRFPPWLKERVTNLAIVEINRGAEGWRGSLGGVRGRSGGGRRPVRVLSGGNQQKVGLGRWLVGTRRVLLLDEPTRGVDVGARAELYRHITALAQSGVAVLLASSDIDEVINLSHRVLVMRGRGVVGEVDPTAAGDQDVKENILRLAMGLDQRTDLPKAG